MDDSDWNPDLPIYVQLRERVIALILDGKLKEGEPLPSVRAIAAEYRLNPITALKAYQQLVEDGLLESRRGVGMYVQVGARTRLLADERKRFLAEKWPRLLETMARLDLSPEELLSHSRGQTPRQRKKQP